jgi:heat shock protein HtpX
MLTGHPGHLATALQKISGDMAAIPDRDLREVEPVSAFFFSPAFTRATSLTTLFATHPPLEKRLDQLARISAELGRE